MTPALERLVAALEDGASIREAGLRLTLAHDLCDAAWRALAGQGDMPEPCQTCGGAGTVDGEVCRPCRGIGMQQPS